MTRKINIENPQVKTKIKNFIKTCDSVISSEKDLNGALLSANAFKVLLRFLKNDSALIDVHSKFDSSPNITEAYAFAQEIVANDFTVTFEDNSAEDDDVLNFKYKIGDIVFLGWKFVRKVEQPLAWKVIKKSEDKILLLAEKSYLWEPFDINGDLSWEQSSLRQKLNTEWFDEIFSENEKDVIVEQENNDKVFILTLDEIIELVPTSAERRDSKSNWWTCTPTSNGALESIRRNGDMHPNGVIATKKQGVRPALWIINPVKNTVEEPQLTAEAESLPVRKVIIVENGDDYFIAYASPQAVIDSLFLKMYSSESAHFDSIEAAQNAVEVFKTVNDGKYKIEVSSISLIELINKEYEIATQKCTITDKDGYPILYIDSRGKKTFPLREEDGPIRLIDKNKYAIIINELMENEKAKLDEQFDHYYIGTSIGYEVASNCDAAHIRYEIFKARGVIESFNEYPSLMEMHSDDEKYYNGYIDALTNALNIQHECIFQKCNWSVDIVDLRSKEVFTVDNEMEGNFSEFGHYAVRIYNVIPTIDFNDGSRHIVIAFVHKGIDWIMRDTELALNLPSDVPIVFGDEKQQVNKTQLYRLVKTTIGSQCELGGGEPDYIVSPELVPALANFSALFKDESEDDKDEEDFDSADFVNKTPTLDLRLMDGDEVLYDYKFKNNRILRSVKLPLNMKRISEGLFYGCKSLDYVFLPDNLSIIGLSAFEGCTSLWKLFLPDSIQKIEDRAFYGCDRLKSIFLPEKLEYIGSYAFYGCIRLSSIHIPANIKYIADDAFDDCFALTQVLAPIGCRLPAFLLSQAKVKYYGEQDDCYDIEDGFARCNSPDDITELNENIVSPIQADLSADSEVKDGVAVETDKDTAGVNADVVDAFNNDTNYDNPNKEIDLLNNTLLLLDNTFDSELTDLSSIINLLSKEYKNDQI